MQKIYQLSQISPQNGAVTAPLQAFEWLPEESQADPGTPIVYVNAEGLDRSLPRPVEFAWKALDLKGDSLQYELAISPTPDFSNYRKFNGLKEARARVWNLQLGASYHWKVIARRKGQIVAESPVWSFTTHAETPRWIYIPNVTNMRDIGGWRLDNGRSIRQGMVYRSSELNGHVQLTEEGRRILLDELQIRTDLDLRGEGELCEPVLEQLRYFNVPILPYAHIGDEAMKPLYRKIFAILADAKNYPILVHCWGGADRTGTVMFLLEGLLGVDEGDLFRDYELTSLSIWGERRHTSLEFQEFLRTLAGFSSPNCSYQEQVLGYLGAIGVTPDEIESIQRILTDNALDLQIVA